MIFGGIKTARHEWTNTVALTDKSGIYCSGTALAPNLILTAAHCLDGAKVKKLKVYVGEGAQEGSIQGQYRAESFGQSPDYNVEDEGTDHDIGYVVLKDSLDLPQSAYVPVAATKDEVASLVAVNQPTEIVGYGLRENKEFGHKYHAKTRITKVDSTVVTIGGNGIDACNGDSGGPAFGRLKDGTLRIFGVASNGEDCGMGGAWSLIHPDICWLMKDSGVDLGIEGIRCGGKGL
jgi:secreted trypsin-like serine protease